MEPKDLEPIPTQPRDHRVGCRSCGHLNSRSARFCEKCGAKIDLAAVAQSYVAPLTQRFGLLLLLAVPIIFVCLAAVSFIANGLGFGGTVRPIVNTVILVFGIGSLAIVFVGLAILYFVYRNKK